MSRSWFWLFLAVALPVLAAVVAPMSTVDLTYQLRAGAQIVDLRTVPTVDTWTFTAAGLPWSDQQWGAQVVLALFERVGGWTGLVILRAILTGIVFGCLVVIGTRRGLDARRTALLVLVALVIAAPAMALRPQLFGMACFAVVLLLITERRRHPRCLWVVPIVVAIWANMHGSFFLGPLMLGLAWLEDVHDRAPSPHRSLVIALVSVAAACLTPSGPLVWVYAVGLSTSTAVTTRITEWQPTSIRTLPGLLFFGSVMAVVALIARQGRMVSWPMLAWLATFFVIGAYAGRGVAWWPLAALPVVAGLLVGQGVADPAAPSPTPDGVDPPAIRRLNVIVVGVLVVVAIALLPVWRPVDAATGLPVGVLTQAPPGVTAAVVDAAAPGDRILNAQTWGSWFEYRVPAATVAVDSRIELFPADVWDRYGKVMAGVDGWQDQLAAWDVRIAALTPDQTATRDRLLAAGWVDRYAGDDGFVLRRP